MHTFFVHVVCIIYLTVINFKHFLSYIIIIIENAICYGGWFRLFMAPLSCYTVMRKLKLSGVMLAS